MNDLINFIECIVCQKTDKKKTLVKQPKIASLEALKEALEERKNCKDVSIEIHQRLANHSAEYLLKQSAKYHSSCYKTCTHIKTLTQVRNRFKDSLEGKTSKTIGRPEKRKSDTDDQNVAKRLRSSFRARFDKKMCVICQDLRQESLHTVEYLKMGIKMLDVSRKLSDKTLFLRLNSISAADDGVANDVQYHRY